MEKLGRTFEELNETELLNINGGATPTVTTTSSGYCLAMSAAVGGGITGAVTFIVSATFRN